MRWLEAIQSAIQWATVQMKRMNRILPQEYSLPCPVLFSCALTGSPEATCLEAKPEASGTKWFWREADKHQKQTNLSSIYFPSPVMWKNGLMIILRWLTGGGVWVSERTQ
ncbi:uncharacterized protein LOC110074302 [Pogona vitticeps]